MAKVKEIRDYFDQKIPYYMSRVDKEVIRKPSKQALQG